MLAVLSAGAIFGPPSGGWAEDVGGGGLGSLPETRKDARVIEVSIPAPRGRILGRRGGELAGTVAAERLAYWFPDLAADAADDEVVAAFARDLRDQCRALGVGRPEVGPEKVVRHYRLRRHLPLVLEEPVYAPGRAPRPDGAVLGPRFTFQTIYLRHYPDGGTAAHVVGYVGQETPMETGPVVEGENYFEDFAGRAGLEASFDARLTGSPGRVSLVVDGDGTLAASAVVRERVPGHDVVTTIDGRQQRLAEEVLAGRCRRGALVVCDPTTGAVRVLASAPSFDPNVFVPAIGRETFEALQSDPDAPLFPRATAGLYPPASAFKPVVALGCLRSGAVTPGTVYHCPVSMVIDGRTFRNWNLDHPEGNMAVGRAIARSNNTWFFQAALASGAAPILEAARALGFGSAPDLPLRGVAAGHLPAPSEAPHAIVNLSIGQGEVLASPLQLARAIGAIGNGRFLAYPQLVSEIRTAGGKVVEAFPPQPKAALPFSATDIATVQHGMHLVINSEFGSARDAALDHVTIAGKTGTAQWGKTGGLPRYLAWFTGFVESPDGLPELAFCALFEGAPGEPVEGHSHAAPIATEFLRTVYANPEHFGVTLPQRRVLVPPPAAPPDSPP